MEIDNNDGNNGDDNDNGNGGNENDNNDARDEGEGGGDESGNGGDSTLPLTQEEETEGNNGTEEQLLMIDERDPCKAYYPAVVGAGPPEYCYELYNKAAEERAAETD